MLRCCRRQVCARRRTGEEAKLTVRDEAVALLVVIMGAAIVAGVAESERDQGGRRLRLAAAAAGSIVPVANRMVHKKANI